VAVRYTERPAAMRALLYGPSGPVATHVRQVALLGRDLAMRKADAKLHVRTGQYHGGFATHDSVTGQGPSTTLSNSAPWATIIELGSRPHLIVPRRPGGMLRFQVRGRTVYARKVNHPGTRPTHIMLDSVREAMRRLG
jgi:hypothetical protein